MLIVDNKVQSAMIRRVLHVSLRINKILKQEHKKQRTKLIDKKLISR